MQCVAVWCSVMQCVAVWCSAIQCDTVCCSVLQCVVVCCSVLQCVAVCCSVLQCVAVCCSVSQCVAVFRSVWRKSRGPWLRFRCAGYTFYVRRALICVKRARRCVKRALLRFDFVFALSIFHGFELEAWYSAVHMLTGIYVHTYTYIFKYFDKRPQSQLFMNQNMCTNAWISKKLIYRNPNFTNSNVHICRSPQVQTFKPYKYVPKYNSNRNSYFNPNSYIKKLRLRLRLG